MYIYFLCLPLLQAHMREYSAMLKIMWIHDLQKKELWIKKTTTRLYNMTLLRRDRQMALR